MDPQLHLDALNVAVNLGGGLRLRRYDARLDVEPMLAAYSDPREQAFFANREHLNSIQEFDEWMTVQVNEVYHDFYTLEATSKNAEGDTAGNEVSPSFAGFVYSYGYRDFDLHCIMGIYLTPKWRKTGIGGRVAATFLDELFAYYPLRKVYLYVYDFNKESLASDLEAGFVEEGLLREWRFFDGRWWDCHVLALTREAFGEHLARFSALGLATSWQAKSQAEANERG